MPPLELALVLHGHLPFVRHPEHPEFLEELWLFEAITDTYVPLLMHLERLADAGVKARVALGISPPLATMLRDPLLLGRYLRHLSRLIELSHREVRRTVADPALSPLAQFYVQTFEGVRTAFVERYHQDLVGAFAALERRGVVELFTTTATHAFLLLLGDERLVRAQLRVGIDEHERLFGRAPAGLWLPECGYYEGLDAALDEAGVGWFVVDGHGLLFATPRPSYATYAPVRCPRGPVAFARDGESSRQVWSATEGYPGDPDYRELYRDLAFELSEEEIRPFLPAGIRTGVGIKYRRITGPTEQKEPYVRERALARAGEHAQHFLAARRRQASALAQVMPERAPLVVAPYDAELFGHWWFEGPEWLASVLEGAAGAGVTLVTPGDVIASGAALQTCQPATSSWGERGYAEVWLNEQNDWIYPQLHAAGARLCGAVERLGNIGGVPLRALTQAGRELLLAQSSDWAFIMRAGTHVEYARRRTSEHIAAVLTLCHQAEHAAVDEAALADLEARHNIFPELDVSVFASA
jgi:1,4-alpha-glucan branching enzyme